MFKVLVFAMLSSTSGWGLPSDDPLLLSKEATNIMGGVDGARDGRQLEKDNGWSCDWGCNEGCNGWWSCDGNCNRGCDNTGSIFDHDR